MVKEVDIMNKKMIRFFAILFCLIMVGSFIASIVIYLVP